MSSTTLGSHSVSVEIAGRTLTIETGNFARQATSAVMIHYGESSVLCTCMRAKPRPGLDFFPMQVDYREKLPAGGKFPGGFRKREGAPNEKEVLTMRMIDRPIRPLFPDGFIDEVQIQCWVMSHDGENDTDTLASIGASAALHLSSAPYEGPIATVRVGRVWEEDEEGNDRYKLVLNPTTTQLEYSDLDLVLSGHKDGINMIEVGAAEVPDDEVHEAIAFGFEGIEQILPALEELREKCGLEKYIDSLNLPSDEIADKVKSLATDELTTLRQIPAKAERNDKIGELRDRIISDHFPLNEGGTPGEYEQSKKDQGMAREAFRTLEKKITRKLIVESKARADGRGPTDIRGLESKVGVFSRTHGSALFTRGETQSICTATLGTGKDEQVVDGLLPEYSKKFYLHYNFPPFSVGEAGRIMGPGRREIGHGALAERSLMGILPSPEEFPYTIRIVSDITESNGSSSMASICGGCLALMDAGVPIAGTCAGVSVGRFADENGENEVFVTDIIGEEDFFGDMDFKVGGTRDGITGIQLDLKARGLSIEQIKTIFDQARIGRIQIIEHMESVIPEPRADIHALAPRIHTLNIDPDKIGKLIGPGGKMIRGLQDKWGVNIDVEDDGTVMISSSDKPSLDGAVSEVEALCAEIKVGSIYEGKVVSVKDFGAFIEIAQGTDGMCHISELDNGYVGKVSDVVSIGDSVRVKVINVDDQGRIKLSRKALLEDEPKDEQDEAAGEESETPETESADT